MYKFLVNYLEEIMGIFDFESKRSAQQVPDPRLIELSQLVKEAAAAITILEKEIEIRDQKIEILSKDIYHLRAELKKRTEQYSDLVDLAREKGVIGE